MVYEKGINDMSRGWASKNKENNIIYTKWNKMLQRVYDEKFHEKQPTYINSSICLEWHWLSKFAEDFKNIDGYNKEKLLNGELDLDKDIKSNGKNREYSLDNCMLIDKTINRGYYQKYNPITEETKRKMSENHADFNGKNNPNYGNHKLSGINSPSCRKIVQCDLDNNLIKIWDYVKQVSEEYGWNNCTITDYLRGKRKSHEYKGYNWFYYEDYLKMNIGDEENGNL